MSISKETIIKTAELAHLELSETEQNLYVEQIGNILKYVSLLNEVNTVNIEPMIAATDMSFTFRDDEVKKETELDALLKNAPDKYGNLFRVPPIL